MNETKTRPHWHTFITMLLICLSFIAGSLTTTAAFGQDLDVIEAEDKAVAAVLKAVGPSVVKIETFGGLERVDKKLVGLGPTTGLVVGADGYVISSAFNFRHLPTSILVTLDGEKRYPAKIVARDQSTMLVLLKIKADKLPVPQSVGRDKMQVGQTAIAIGRTYSNAPHPSVGILSAKNRVWGKALQTDAKISPGNYGGPLCDLHGRVMGVLVPLTPRAQGATAGSEWYDSGIGFAVPMTTIKKHLETLKKGTDLKAGLLGIAFKSRDIYADPAVIGACPANSPAAKAGIKVGDEVIEIDGKPIVRQAQLKTALGPKYAGESVKITVLRSKKAKNEKKDDKKDKEDKPGATKKEDRQRLEFTVTLSGVIEPYSRPFLGILPMRAPAAADGVTVRATWPGSPAEKAGLKPGDRITLLGTTAITNLESLHAAIANTEMKETAIVTFLRDGKENKVEITPTDQPEDRLAAQPADSSLEGKYEGKLPDVGVVDLKLPEEPNECYALVPDNYDPRRACGLVVLLDAPGKGDRQALVKSWKEACEKHNLIVLVPRSSNDEKWQRTETEFIRKAIDNAIDIYNIDGNRVVVHGLQGGASMAWLTAYSARDLVRGLAPVDAAMPMTIRPPEPNPLNPLSIFLFKPTESRTARAIAATAVRLRKMKYPVSLIEQPGKGRALDKKEIDELSRWIDTLDRI